MNPQTVPPAPAPDPDLVRFYENDARWYSGQLRLEHIMESTPQATQRKISLESFDLVRRARPEVQCFNELLIQYPVAGQRQPGRVVPDNFIVLHPAPLGPLTSFPIPTLPARPFFVLEYVSKHNVRKDYEDNLVRYEQALRVPYYLVFYPDADEMTLFRLAADRYEAVGPNDAGRVTVPELELEAALVDGWVRFWFRGALLPLPAELADQLDAARRERDAARVELTTTRQERDAERAARATAEQEIARLKELLARAGGAP